MFKNGDKVVCIKEPPSNKYLNYGQTYTVLDFDAMKNSPGLIRFYEIPEVTFSSHRFKNVVEFRKEKIIKLKERLNGNKT